MNYTKAEVIFSVEGVFKMESTVPSNSMKKVGGVSLVFSKTNTAKKLQPSSAISEIKEPNNKEPDFVSALEDKKVHRFVFIAYTGSLFSD